MGNYIVTGGAGFIGSHLARKLLSRGHQVLILDDLSTGNKKNIPTNAIFLKTDLSDRQELKKIPRRSYDGVMHLAAQSSGEISFENPYRDCLVNAGSTLLLLEWCLKNDVERFIFSSSMSVYGSDEKPKKKENYICRPNSFYGISKLASENYIRLFAEKGIKSTIFRLFNVYGPGQNLENLKQGMVSIYLAYVLRKKPILVKGAPERFRDLTYIDDVVEAWTKSIDEPKTFGRTYNLATGKKTTVKELINLILSYSGRESSYPITHSTGTPGDIFGYVADISSIKKDLAWKPYYSIRKGLKVMVEYYLQASAGGRPAKLNKLGVSASMLKK